MIWLILFIIALIAALFLTAPLLPAKTRDAKMRISLFIALFIGASLGVYGLIGTPNISGLSSFEDTAAPQPNVTPEQITAMVDRLAARLVEDPEDPEGWTRLLRSRIVLGDTLQLVKDHKTMAKVYETRPEIMVQISEESGFNTFAKKVLSQP